MKNITIQKLLLEMLESYTKLIREDDPDFNLLVKALVVNYAAKIAALFKGGNYA